MHGHELDTVVQNLGWLAHAGDIVYTLLLRCNGLVNFSPSARFDPSAETIVCDTTRPSK